MEEGEGMHALYTIHVFIHIPIQFCTFVFKHAFHGWSSQKLLPTFNANFKMKKKTCKSGLKLSCAYLNDGVRKDLQRANSINKSQHDLFVALHHIREGVVDFWLKLELVYLLWPQKLKDHRGYWKQGVENEQEESVVTIEKVIWFLSWVFEP